MLNESPRRESGDKWKAHLEGLVVVKQRRKDIALAKTMRWKCNFKWLNTEERQSLDVSIPVMFNVGVICLEMFQGNDGPAGITLFVQ